MAMFFDSFQTQLFNTLSSLYCDNNKDCAMAIYIYYLFKNYCIKDIMEVHCKTINTVRVD